MSIQKELIPITFSDNVSNQLGVFKNEMNKKTMLFLPALGVKAAYYDKFGEHLAANGFNFVSMDWRGLGYSSVRASRKVNYSYKDFINDIGETVDWITEHFENTALFIGGHSLGGQLGGLYLSRFPQKAKGLYAIASCSVYHKGWSGKDSWSLHLAGLIFNPVASIVGHFPGKQLGFGGREFRGVMQDWVYTLKTGKYEPKHDTYDYEASMSKATFPILAISIENDFMAPRAAVENLLAKYTNGTKKHVQIPNKDKKLNHFKWAKRPEVVEQIIRKEENLFQ